MFSLQYFSFDVFANHDIHDGVVSEGENWDSLGKSIYDKILNSLIVDSPSQFKNNMIDFNKEYSMRARELSLQEEGIEGQFVDLLHGYWLMAMTSPYSNTSDNEKPILFELLYNKKVVGVEKKLKVLISFGLLVQPRTGNFFLDSISKINEELLVGYFLSDCSKSIKNIVLLKAMDPKKIIIDEFFDGHFDYHELNDFLVKNCESFIRYSLKKKDMRSLFQITKMIVHLDAPLLHLEVDELSLPYYRVPILDRVLFALANLRSKIEKQFDPGLLPEAISFFFADQPFELKNIDAIYRLDQHKTRVLSEKQKESIDSYIRLGIVRDYMLAQIGKKAFLDKDLSPRELWGFLKYLKADDLLFHELSVYDGLNKLVPMPSVIKKSIKNGCHLNAALYLYLFSHCKMLLRGKEGENYLHWILDSNLVISRNDRLMFLRLFLYSGRLSHTLNLRSILQENETGVTPLQLSKNFEEQDFCDLLIQYLKENNSYRASD